MKSFTEIQAEVKKLEGDIMRAEGSLEATMEALKTKYNCATIEEAITKLEELRENVNTTTTKRDSVLTKLQGLREW